VVERFNSVDPDAQLGPQLRAFTKAAARILTASQEQVAEDTRDYFRDLAQREGVKRPPRTPLASDNAGRTIDGRALEEALRTIPAKVLLALKSGRKVPEALAYGRFAVARMAQTEIMDTARIELDHQMVESPDCRGWRWRSRGTCGACLALDDGSAREPGETMEAHPFCECVQDPMFRSDRLVRPTGHDKLYQLDDEEQTRLLGFVGATLLRQGKISPADLVVTQTHETWRPVVTMAAAATLLDRAGVSEEEIRAEAGARA